MTVPFRLGIELRAMRKLEAQLTQDLGRAPTQAELVAEVRRGCAEQLFAWLAQVFLFWMLCETMPMCWPRGLAG